jgi:hypothetical protein
MLKFRKMRPDATGAALTVDADDRLTRVGGILTRTRLDELPQFWHVLRGDMSLKLAVDLKRQFARGCHDQGERFRGPLEMPGLAEQGGSNRKAEGHGLPRAGLRRNEHVSARRLRLEHGRLDRRRLGIPALGERADQIGMKRGKGHFHAIGLLRQG